MPTRRPAKLSKDGKGFKRQLGWKLNARGERVQHKFRLGGDEEEARRREERLVTLWADVEWLASNPDLAPHRREPLWTTTSLWIAKAFARGETVITVPVAGEDHLAFARKYRQLTLQYRSVQFRPANQAAYDEGAAKCLAIHRATENVARAAELEHAHRDALRSGLHGGVGAQAGGPRLHAALDAYAAWIRRTMIDVPLPMPSGNTRVKNVGRLKERHADVPLSSLRTLKPLQELFDYWRLRPAVKRRKHQADAPDRPIRNDTARHHIRELDQFLRWLHLDDDFDWRLPDDYVYVVKKVAESVDELDEESGELAVVSYTSEQVRILFEYGTPMDRLLLLLGLNCGFGASEMGTLKIRQIFFNRAHPHAKRFRYDASDEDCYISRLRRKNRVWGVHLLWKLTSDAIRWQIDELKAEGFPTGPKDLLFRTDRGTPCWKTTKGGNAGQWFANRWKGLTERIRKDHADFPALSFGKLRKTGGDMVRQLTSGEVARIYLCHGSPVTRDKLIKAYTNPKFGKVFRTLLRLERELDPIFASVGAPFAPHRRQTTSLAVQRRVLELRGERLSMNRIGELVGVSHSTVKRILDKAAEAAAATPAGNVQGLPPLAATG